MNKRTAYEIIIAEKAEKQPLPDMADAIWASVSARLDQLPPPSGESQAGTAAPAAKGISAWHLMLYGLGVAAVITTAVLFWWPRQPRQAPTPKQPPAVMPAAPARQPGKDVRHPDSVRLKPPVIRYAPPVEIKQPPIDSARTINDALQNSRPQGAIQISPPRMPLLNMPDTTSIHLPQARKPHGVKGISDSDYKIVPEKQDSSLLHKN